MATWQKDNRVRRLRKQIEQLVAAHQTCAGSPVLQDGEGKRIGVSR